MKKNNTLIVSLPLNSSFGRGVLKGIISYVKAVHDWQVSMIDLRNLDVVLGNGMNSDSVSQIGGIIAHAATNRIEAAVVKSGYAAVNVSNRLSEQQLPGVHSNDQEVGMLAAEHFLDLGFHSFIYVGLTDHLYSQQRKAGFEKRVSNAGYSVKVIEYPVGRKVASTLEIALQDALLGLPFPVAILGENDGMALDVLNIVLKKGYKVPDEIGVMGVDGDELIRQRSPREITSILPGVFQIGFEAARLIVEGGLMKKNFSGKVFISPEGISYGSTTDFVFSKDKDFEKAFRYLQRMATQPISVDEIARYSGMSRRKLERKFRDNISSSPYAEILRIRLKHARTLLANGNQGIEEISRICGFKTPREFYHVFRKHLGMAPSHYRKKLELVEQCSQLHSFHGECVES